MRTVLAWFAITAVLTTGCAVTDTTSPEGAFAAIAPCMDKRDMRCLYFGLDRESQWSVQTMHRTLGRIRALVLRSYPENMRDGAYGSWRHEAEAEDPPALFERFCRRNQCMARLVRGFGAVTRTTPLHSDGVQIDTTRGERFEMRRADGKWGLSLYRVELQQAKIHLLDRLRQVEQNAAEYDQQRKAGVEVK